MPGTSASTDWANESTISAIYLSVTGLPTHYSLLRDYNQEVKRCWKVLYIRSTKTPNGPIFGGSINMIWPCWTRKTVKRTVEPSSKSAGRRERWAGEGRPGCSPHPPVCYKHKWSAGQLPTTDPTFSIWTPIVLCETDAGKRKPK